MRLLPAGPWRAAWRHWPCFAAIAVALALTPRPAWADDSDASGPEVVVTGERVAAQSGPGVSVTGANSYGVTARDITDLPTGDSSPMTDVLAQMPGVAIDQNQQIHIRDTEGPQFQYQINGVLVPLDINTNPSFLSMLNPLFVKQLDLLDGVLPARYSYATGGVIDIVTKDGCDRPGDSVSTTAGARRTVEANGQIAACAQRASAYLSASYGQGETAFSSATPGPNPIHDDTHQGQALGHFVYDLTPRLRLSLTLSGAASDNQLPNVAGLAQQFALAGVSGYPSSAINSTLNFRDGLGILALRGETGPLTYRLAYAAHVISQDFRPDPIGELVFQGVASRATHRDIDNTLQGDVTYAAGAHTLSAGVYAGAYDVTVRDSSLVFPLDPSGQPLTTPVAVASGARAANRVVGVYVDDLWRIADRLKADFGLRLDGLTGFTNAHQLNPTLNLTYQLTPQTTLHAGAARYFQVPSFQGITPDAATAFAGTTAAAPPGTPNPLAEDDTEWDAGVVYRPTPHLTLSQDSFYEATNHYLDTGQFGVTPIFAPFNYGRGYMWGAEFAARYRSEPLSAYVNLSLGRNIQKGVATGQFNFDPDELAYIDRHAIPLDHQPLVGISAGGTWRVQGWLFGADLIYSSGLRAGFADQTQLPQVVQINAAIERRFTIPGGGVLANRVTILNVLDRINLIRPADGIGIYQAAYGPRFTLLDTLSLRF